MLRFYDLKPKLKTTKYMSKIREVLDCAIRDAEGNRKGGYVGKSGKVYPNYMHNEEWAEYKKMIPDEVKEKLKKETEGIPPKMACFGSSCRIAYDKLKDVEGVEFEKILSTIVSRGKANLDAYVKRGNLDIFVEAKCGEIYIEESPYLSTYKEIQKRYKKFTYSADISSFMLGDKPIIHFDIKQLICHFLGITAGLLKGTITAEKVRFVYLIYNPNDVKEFIADDKYRDEILEQYQATLDEIDLFDMKELFKTIYEFQKENLKIKRNIKEGFIVESCFEFKLVDQNHLNGLFD